MIKLNFKINTSQETTKINFVKEFILFCQKNSPLKKSINVVFVDKSYINNIPNKIIVELENKSEIDILNDVSVLWIKEFSNQRKIVCKNKESELLVKFFLKDMNLN